MRKPAHKAKGHPGQTNPRAVLTDRDVEALRDLADERDERGRRVWTQKALAEKFGVSWWTVAAIVQGRRR